jgi:hypothetical protein
MSPEAVCHPRGDGPARDLSAENGFHLRNLGPLRQKGVEVSLDHRVSCDLTACVNYSWQGQPISLPASNPYPTQELAYPPTNCSNVGFNFDVAASSAARR